MCRFRFQLMSATVFTAKDAEKAKIELITDEAKGNQAVHDVVVAIQAARRSGTACAKTKGDVIYAIPCPARRETHAWVLDGVPRVAASATASPAQAVGGS
mgnify:CR=1 FL=1